MKLSGFVVAVIVVLLIGILVSIGTIAFANLTQREGALLSVFLTLLSIAATWIASHAYAQLGHEQAIAQVKSFHQENLRTCALKAAEKVNNLSNELSRLALYLQQELDAVDYPSAQEDLAAKQERLESAIHIVTTLRSMNDTFLSDWEGVIGAELNEQREALEERREDLRTLAARLDSLVTTQRQDLQHLEGAHREAIRQEIAEIKEGIRLLSGVLTGTPLKRPRKARLVKEAVTRPCPSCSQPVEYEQRPRSGGVKGVQCPNCGSKLISLYRDEKGFSLEVMTRIEAEPPCPWCEAPVTLSIDNVPTAVEVFTCPHCSGRLKVSMGTDGLRVRGVGPGPSAPSSEPAVLWLKEEDIAAVDEALPPQPWPKHTHKAVAARLGLSITYVERIVKELIRRGRRMQQVDGQLYVSARPRGDSVSTDPATATPNEGMQPTAQKPGGG